MLPRPLRQGRPAKLRHLVATHWPAAHLCLSSGHHPGGWRMVGLLQRVQRRQVVAKHPGGNRLGGGNLQASRVQAPMAVELAVELAHPCVPRAFSRRLMTTAPTLTRTLQTYRGAGSHPGHGAGSCRASAGTHADAGRFAVAVAAAPAPDKRAPTLSQISATAPETDWMANMQT